MLQGIGALADEDRPRRIEGRPAPSYPVQIVTSAALGEPALARLLDRAVVAGQEQEIVAALGLVEDGVSRIAAIERASGGTRGIVVGVRDAQELVPLGSLGDGMGRMLGIALSLQAARGGTLLIDELDTGLHHTVLQKVGRLVHETARRLDVTAVATTHRLDCVRALGAIARGDVEAPGEVGLFRVERGRPNGVRFSEAEITRLAGYDIKAR